VCAFRNTGRLTPQRGALTALHSTPATSTPNSAAPSVSTLQAYSQSTPNSSPRTRDDDRRLPLRSTPCLASHRMRAEAVVAVERAWLDREEAAMPGSRDSCVIGRARCARVRRTCSTLSSLWVCFPIDRARLLSALTPTPAWTPSSSSAVTARSSSPPGYSSESSRLCFRSRSDRSDS
jgi:hypothetical protein